MEDCAFELGYVHPENRISDEELIAQKRIRMGALLARRYPAEADFVVPIPETAIHFAQGYSHESGIPLCHAVFKNRPKQRTLFIENRGEIIQDVFTIIPGFIADKRIVIVDETLISGLSLRTVLNKIRELKPKTIHLRLANPPMIRRCPSSEFGHDWSFDGMKVFSNGTFASVEHLSCSEVRQFARCAYCFGDKDENSKVVRY